MLAKVTSCAVVGLDGALVDVEVDVSNGQPGFTKAVPQTQSISPA
jgi:magnesium chelatase family protein